MRHESNKVLKEDAAAKREDAAAREAQWRAGSQASGEQMTVLRDENEDLRFQVGSLLRAISLSACRFLTDVSANHFVRV